MKSVQVAKNGEFYDRIFPIVLANAQIYDPIEILKYIEHWETKTIELDNAMKRVAAANLQGIREKIDLYTEIRNTIAQLTDLLQNMNTLSADIHQQSEFEELIKAIENRINQDAISQHTSTKPQLEPHTIHSHPQHPQPSLSHSPNRNQPTINYQDFQILVDKNNNIRADSQQGEVWSELRLERNQIELALQLIESEKTNSNLLKTFGNQLYQALFPNQINAKFHATMAAAEKNQDSVRLRLIFESPELATLPWELLYDQGTNTFLANNIQTVLSRYIDVPLQKRDIKTATLPLKVLLVISTPTDLPSLDTTAEQNLIQQALKKHIETGQIQLDILQKATRREIQQKLREKPYNIFHFIGHGEFNNNKGYIVLVDENDKAKLLDDETFANFFLGDCNLGLVILNCCKGAAVSSNQPFAGTAANLVRRGIPAVVAMQYPIWDSTAKLFADKFYRTLAQGYPVDAAIQKTRNLISMEVGLDKPDFATPVLYMRAKDGIILNGF